MVFLSGHLPQRENTEAVLEGRRGVGVSDTKTYGFRVEFAVGMSHLILKHFIVFFAKF